MDRNSCGVFVGGHGAISAFDVAAVDEDGRSAWPEIYWGAGLISPIFAQKRRANSALLPGKLERTGRKGRRLVVHEIRIDLDGIPTLWLSGSACRSRGFPARFTTKLHSHSRHPFRLPRYEEEGRGEVRPG